MENKRYLPVARTGQLRGLCRRRVFGILSAMGLMSATALIGAERFSNSFVTVEGDGVRIADDGSIHFPNAKTPVAVEVTARPGWKVNGKKSLSLNRAPGASGPLRVTSDLGEDSEHIPLEDCQFGSEVTNIHVSPPAISIGSDGALAMYALPQTSVWVSVSATCETVSNGVHEIVTKWLPCPVCPAVGHDPAEETNTVSVAPEIGLWTASGAGVTANASTWAAEMAKGRGQQISFRVDATNDCAECRNNCHASTNVVVDVYELSVTNDLYLGLDRTDAGRANPAVKTGTAVIDPMPSGSVTYAWTDCGICSFTGRTDQAVVRYFAPNPDAGSASHLAEPLTVEATVEDGGLTASATCTTNFTVVKVDVAIANVGEDKEETEGAFVLYVPDTNGLITVEGTNQMKKVAVTFSCAPTNLPTNEVVTITSSGPGELYEELADGTLVRITTTNYPACEISSHVFKLHGHDVSAGVRDGVIRIDHDSSGAVDEAEYTVVDVDLRATDLFGAVDDSMEHDAGAYVHWNIDNDDSSDNTIGAPKHPGGDYLQAGAGQVVGENDLKALTSVISPALAEGTAVLRIDKDKAKLWKNAEKSDANLILAGAGERRWNLADGQERQQFYSICSSLFVEGVGNGEGNITLSYEAPSGGSDCSDKVKYTFISANCGRQPRTDGVERSIYETHFPCLVRCEWSITEEPTPRYNCIAWSVGETTAWYVDVAASKVHPSDIAIDDVWGNGNGVMTYDELDAFYNAKGYVPTGTNAHDSDVMFYSLFHGARKKSCSCMAVLRPVFESKCGEGHRVEHLWDQLNGTTYGTPVRFYKHK